MREISLLDCTLRDGGYCNNWEFGNNAISQVIQGLENSGVEIIECGYLSNRKMRKNGSTIYNSVTELENPIVNRSFSKCKYVCMINYGEVDIDAIPEHYEATIDGIRVAFHKKDMKSAIDFCQKLVNKGYLVFVQPMVILDYAVEEIKQLIEWVNSINIYALYIVDSFGAMNHETLCQIFNLFDSMTNRDIRLGFHGHNNLLMSYSNAQIFVKLGKNRNIIVDSCIFGMGRGAGNLETELFEEYLNNKYGKDYKIAPILNIYDQVLEKFYLKNSWGYSIPNYLSAKYNSHPNYAQYWNAKNTLSASDINRLFENIDETKKNSFDRNYAEQLYVHYMSRNTIREGNLSDFERRIQNRNIMIIASGLSNKIEKDVIINCIEENNCIVIAINQDYVYYESDYIFASNLRRFESIEKKNYNKMITTSNIENKDVYATIAYDKYLNHYETVEDNAVLMLLSYLSELETNKIFLAGVDGFSHNIEENYADSNMLIKTSNDIFDKRNIGIQCCLKDLKKKMNIQQVTTPKYIEI